MIVKDIPSYIVLSHKLLGLITQLLLPKNDGVNDQHAIQPQTGFRQQKITGSTFLTMPPVETEPLKIKSEGYQFSLALKFVFSAGVSYTKYVQVRSHALHRLHSERQWNETLFTDAGKEQMTLPHSVIHFGIAKTIPVNV